MTLRSYLFEGDAQLNAALVLDSAHVVPGAVGTHVTKIQMALEVLDNAVIPADEKLSMVYGPGTASAVLAYKTARSIIGPFQTHPDNIVGKMTTQRMDDELAGGSGSRAEMMATAHARSRQSLRSVHARLNDLQIQIDQIAIMPEPGKGIALAGLLTSHARDILVIARRLVVSADPLSAQFRAALQQSLRLVHDNLALPLTITDGGATGRCAPLAGGGIPFGATVRTDPDPRVSLCNPFFSSAADLQRDVVTHEYFHLLGLGDHAVASTNDGLSNANTMAQIVALLFDRFRQHNSDGNEPAIPPLPAP